MNLNRCRKCKAMILWAETTRGKPISLDAAPHPDGNVALTPAGAVFLSPEQTETGRMLGTKRYRPHLATCSGGRSSRRRPQPHCERSQQP